MGQTLSEPDTNKTSTYDANNKYFYGCSHMQGWRLTMEDAHTTLLKLGDTELSFFGVFDGHGGSTIAQYTGESLYRKLLESEHFKKKEYKEAFKDAFLSLDKDLLADSKYATDPSGCTAVTALITQDNHIIVANAGDSRAIISTSGKAKPLSYDHKPTDQTEMDRIQKAGGFVEFGRVNGNLALSRAIGDFEFKQSEHLPAEEQVVTSNPDLIDHQITKDDEFIVLACDGIWDCMSNQEVVEFVHKGIKLGKRLEEICEDMMDHCLADEQTSNGLGYDNMSVIIVAILNGKTKQQWYDAITESSTVSTPTSPCSTSPSSPEVKNATVNEVEEKKEEAKKDGKDTQKDLQGKAENNTQKDVQKNVQNDIQSKKSS
ncbi:phosphatase 2C-like domain-containing protein [Sporodiniella umbellata]|nr:phosphatase 2C-like domain-containing protein [Sporodiniella umbellata]